MGIKKQSQRVSDGDICYKCWGEFRNKGEGFARSCYVGGYEPGDKDTHCDENKRIGGVAF